MNNKLPVALGIGALTLALAACNNDRTDTPSTTAATGATGATDTALADDGTGTMANAGATGDTAISPGMADPTMPGSNVADPGATMGMADADRPGAMASGADAPVTQAAALQMVMEVDQHEIAAADQAKGKKISADAKAYADTLKKDHTKNLAATRALLDSAAGTDSARTADNAATSASADVAAMKSKHEAERKQLASLDGDAYEAAWLDAMVKGHTEALDKLDRQLIPAATDAKVKQHLTTTRSAIASHLETAEKLQAAGLDRFEDLADKMR